jgi:phospholipase C
MVALSIAALLSGASCSSNSGASGGTGFSPVSSPPSGGGPSNYIQHIVVIVQENRSFNDLFATFPGADGTTVGQMKSSSSSGDVPVTLAQVPLTEHCNFAHGYQGFLRNYDDGQMDGFALGYGLCHNNQTASYQYVNPQEITPYWTLAEQYVLGEHILRHIKLSSQAGQSSMRIRRSVSWICRITLRGGATQSRTRRPAP